MSDAESGGHVKREAEPSDLKDPPPNHDGKKLWLLGLTCPKS